VVDPMSFAPTDAALRAELESLEPAELVTELETADPDAGRHVDVANKRRVVRAVEIMRLTGETPSSRAKSAKGEEVRRYVPEVEFAAIGVDPGSAIEHRIDRRLDEMRRGGLLEEVTALKGRLGRTARSAVGYREILDHLEQKTTEAEAFARIAQNTRGLARRQRTWFQRDPRIRWIPWIDDEHSRIERAMEILS
ncbi:MAG: tRNA (adenosine(37)-N6)-dimethylallyltransferase MiaA, partial [Acidimicrobiia bacterium]